MSAIAGFFDPTKDYLASEPLYRHRLKEMEGALLHRGPNGCGELLLPACGLCRSALSLLKNGRNRPILLSEVRNGSHFAVLSDADLYNRKELAERFSLKEHLGLSEAEASDDDLILAGYLSMGPDFVREINGVFAAAIYDESKRTLFLFRDRFGVKPLFYARQGDTLLFSSEMKGIFTWPDFEPRLSRRGLNEVFSLGPARSSGCGVYEDVKEVRPSHFLLAAPDDMREIRYWELECREHTDDYKTTVSHVSELIRDAVLRQMQADVPLCSFLSGGVDSSLVTAICAKELKKQGERLTTYSFDFQDNDKNFRANAFQPSLDAPYVKQMVEYLGSDHHVLTCTTGEQADALFLSVRAHDLPCMADVDSSLLCFCSKVSIRHRAALTGECADEIFGGYPWFHKPQYLHAGTFPWTMDLEARKVLLSDDFVKDLGMDDYVAAAYEASISETPLSGEESPLERERRVLAWLNLRWFMQTLLNRMDRDGAASGLAARVPYADHRIVEYLWNIPWEMKARGGVVKGLLRDAGAGLLPDEVLFRRKSPYPKTYDTGYEALLVKRMREMMENPASPILPFLDRKKTERFLASPSDYGKPWYGQLMAAPQMLAYMLQVNEWMKLYRVKLV